MHVHLYRFGSRLGIFYWPMIPRKTETLIHEYTEYTVVDVIHDFDKKEIHVYLEEEV